MGAKMSIETGMVPVLWLLLGYLLHTTGELCLSPVGLSMVTKLTPIRIGSLMMGFWFLATAFSQYLAGFIAALTGVSGSHGGGSDTIPAPTETVMIYGDVFGKIGLVAAITGVVLVLISPLMKKWMHGVD
jgi:POT family proton-dependent oligopeptide transporter